MRAARTLAVWLLLASALHSQPSVALEALTDRKYYHESARNEVYVEARVRTAGLPGMKPNAAARNLVLILDRSGSMAGEPIAALREAVAAVCASLAEEDFVSIVAFGSEVEVVVESQRQKDVTNVTHRIGQIEPAGGAALYDAINQGAAQLRRHASPVALSQLVLVTDGPPTKGPREANDFVRLAEALAVEGIAISTIGLGDEFDEDVLAAVARVAHGRFRYVDQPSGLLNSLRAEVTRPADVVGHDAELTVEFRRSSAKLEVHSWRPAVSRGSTVTFRLPRLLADEDWRVLVSAEVDVFVARNYLPNVATVRLQWTHPLDGSRQELTQTLSAHFTYDTLAIRDSIDAGVARTAVAGMIRKGLQKAIEQWDRGDPRRAVRALRAARGDARGINFDIEDAGIAELVRVLDEYLGEVQARGLTSVDRKILRSGLQQRFDPPVPAKE